MIYDKSLTAAQIAFIAVLILFIDSVNRVYRVQVELAAASESTGSGGYVCSTPSLPPSRKQNR